MMNELNDAITYLILTTDQTEENVTLEDLK